MPKAARLGDTAGGHGCFPPTVIIAGSSDVSINGKPAARKGMPLYYMHVRVLMWFMACMVERSMLALQPCRLTVNLQPVWAMLLIAVVQLLLVRETF